jgi:hypothetical protein
MYLIQTLSRREAERTRQREPGRGGATRWEPRERAAQTDDDVMTPPQEGAGRGEGADGAAASGIGEGIGSSNRPSQARVKGRAIFHRKPPKATCRMIAPRESGI